MNFIVKHAPSAGSIARPVDQQSSALPLHYGCPPPPQGNGGKERNRERERETQRERMESKQWKWLCIWLQIDSLLFVCRSCIWDVVHPNIHLINPQYTGFCTDTPQNLLYCIQPRLISYTIYHTVVYSTQWVLYFTASDPPVYSMEPEDVSCTTSTTNLSTPPSEKPPDYTP